ncbi:hypothetical protein ACFW9N_19370 [Streptomyces sp. NPDC059496]|uniref:hypothetical protein n=1 Tax=Streptomyces sp. NPDC059496 TaxID=3346851 RepID=UPI0036C8AC91
MHSTPPARQAAETAQQRWVHRFPERAIGRRRSTVVPAPARAFAARHGPVLADVDLPGFWHSGTPLASLLAPGLRVDFVDGPDLQVDPALAQWQ